MRRSAEPNEDQIPPGVPVFSRTAKAIMAAILVGIAAIAIPNFIKARNSSCANACVNNLRCIDSAKRQWALEKDVTDRSAVPLASDIQPYLGRSSNGTLPYCPGDTNRSFATSYLINNLGTMPAL